MILVDINIPTLNQVYDFNLDENVKIVELLDEIGGMLEQSSHSSVCGDRNKLLLCNCDTKKILPLHKTLYQCGVQTGSRLLLV